MPHQRKTTIISKAPAARILIKAGAQRVSGKAASFFSEILYEKSIALSEHAVRIARHSGRRTVMGEDIKMAKSMAKK